MKNIKANACAILMVASISTQLHAQDSDLAQQLSNPVSDLISLPIQSNLDFGIGPGDGQRFTTNIQPVVPMSVDDTWNLISRTIVPIIDQEGTGFGGAGDAFGLGDTVQSFFLSPKESDPIWGVGSAFLLPTATDSALGADKWGVGPTGVVLKQDGPWTYGALANHIWDVAGSGEAQVNATFLQPFLSYTTPDAWTYGINAESTYDWTSNQWTVPVGVTVSKLLTISDQPIQLSLGGRYYAEKPAQAPEWGVRFSITFLFPK